MNYQEQAEKISTLLKTINKKLFKGVHKLIESYGITVPQLLVLRCLIKERNLPISEISKRLSLSNSTISGIVDRLEKEGYVARRRDLKDRRVVHVCLTQKFYDNYKEIPVFQSNYFGARLENLGPEKVDQIIESLSILANIGINHDQ